MKFATIRIDDRETPALGVGDGVLDLSAALGSAAPRDMIDLIRSYPERAAELSRLYDEATRNPSRFSVLPPEAVSWLAPVPNTSKIVCLALNNSANADRIMQGPKHPATFIKPSSALIGHNQPIVCRPEYGRVHPEPELAFVVGRTASRIGAAEAMDYVFGYTIHNDITSPTMRGEDTFHYRAIHPKSGAPGGIEYVDTWVSYPGRYKGADTFACMGPWLVTRSDIPDPHDLTVRCAHRGATVTEDKTGNLFFKIPETLAFISSYMTLLPGDVISMGTALKRSSAGGAVQNIDLNVLGGPVSVEIDGLGELVNPVVWMD